MEIGKLILSAFPLLVCTELIPNGHAALRATVRTAQTVVELEAENDGPQVLSIGTSPTKTLRNIESEKLIDSVLIDNRSAAVHWKLDSHASRLESNRAVFIYQSDSPKLRLSWIWHAPAPNGPVEHVIQIENLDSREVWVPMQDSFRYKLAVRSGTQLQHLFVERGAGKPSAEGTHIVTVPVGYRWQGTSSTYALESRDEPREIIPFFSVSGSKGLAMGWYVGVEFSGRTRLTVNRTREGITGAIGLNPDPGPFRSRLRSLEVFETPVVFVGTFEGDFDALGNQLRPWIRTVFGNPKTWQNESYPLLVNNSWGSGMQVDETLARKMIEDSAELGLEMFHIDAGWFRGVGDLVP